MKLFIPLSVSGSAVLLFTSPPGSAPMEFQQMSPIIFVDAIEPCVPFWTGIGFENIGEVRHGDALGFVMLQKDNAIVMYQSFASAEADVPAIVQRSPNTTTLYIRMKGFDEILGRLREAEVVVPERKTFYGARETFVRAPCGTVVGFAEMDEQE